MLNYREKLWMALDNDDMLMATLTIKQMKEHGCIDEKGTAGMSSLAYACQKGTTMCVDLLLEAGANANQTNNHGWSPLLSAMHGKHVDIAETLIKRGAKINTKGVRDWTPLMYATYWGDIKMVELLIKYRVDAISKNEEDNTALDISIYCGNNEVSELLRHYTN